MFSRRLLPFLLSLPLLAQPVKRFVHADRVPGEIVVRLHKGVSPDAFKSLVPTALVIPLGMADTYLLRVDSSSFPLLTKDPRVAYVEDHAMGSNSLSAPNDSLYASMWHLPAMNMLAAWSLFPGAYLTASSAGNGSGRTLIVDTDTGVDCTHADFINSGGSSTDSASGGQINFALSHAYVATTLGSPCAPWADDNGHGTHVAGDAVAAGNNSIGTIGAGFPLELVEFKTGTSSGSCSLSVIAQSIEDASAIAHLMLVECSGPGYSQVIQDAARFAWQHGMLVNVASGNSGTNSPATSDCNFCIGVGATSSDGTIAGFSNWGPNVRISAPGNNITTTVPGGYGTISGTSEATPFVGSLAGLMLAYDPTTSVAAIIQQIEQTAISSLSGGGKDPYFGYGHIDAYAALSNSQRAGNINGGFTGQVLTTSDVPIAGATVTLGTNVATTDSSGLFQINNVTAGAYSLTVAATGYTTQNMNAVVPPGADAMTDIVMGQAYASITGAITSFGLAAPYTIVQGIQNGLILATTVSNASGNYTLWLPGTGVFVVRATTVGHGHNQMLAATGNVANIDLNIAPTVTGTSKSPTIIWR